MRPPHGASPPATRQCAGVCAVTAPPVHCSTSTASGDRKHKTLDETTASTQHRRRVTRAAQPMSDNGLRLERTYGTRRAARRRTPCSFSSCTTTHQPAPGGGSGGGAAHLAAPASSRAAPAVTIASRDCRPPHDEAPPPCVCGQHQCCAYHTHICLNLVAVSALPVLHAVRRGSTRREAACSNRPPVKAPSAGHLHTLCTAIRRAVVDTRSQHPPCTSPEALCPSAPRIDPLEAGKMDAVLAAVQQAKSPKERLDAAEAWRVRAALATVCAASGAHALCFHAERFLARSTPAPTGGFPRRRAECPPGCCGVRRGGGAAARRQRKGGWQPRWPSRSAQLVALPGVCPPATRPGLTGCVCAGGGRGGGCPARARGCRPGGPGKTSRSFAHAAAAPGGDAGRRPGDCA